MMYSGQDLTYSSDRLIAIQGIVNEEQRSRTGHFINGIWVDNVIPELLWYMRERRRVADWDEPPSWSWASKGGKKRWPLCLYEGWKEELLRTLSISEPRTLTVAGKLVQLSFGSNDILLCCYKWFHEKASAKAGTLMMLGELHYPTFTIWKLLHNGAVCGLAVFDDEKLSSAQCLLLLRTGSDWTV